MCTLCTSNMEAYATYIMPKIELPTHLKCGTLVENGNSHLSTYVPIYIFPIAAPVID